MHCPTCDYLNADGAAVCADCGAGLLWVESRRAAVRFRSQLGATVDRAADRYKRAFEPGRDRPPRPSRGRRPDPSDL